MSRLIDADLLKKEISNLDKWLIKREKEGYGTTLGELLGRIQYVVSNQPTTFDIEKVLEQLRNERKMPYYCDAENAYFNKGIATAIEIVKAGGVDETRH